MRPIKLTVALALATVGCSAPFTYPDLAKAKDTYAHATKTGDPKKFPKEFDDAKKSIGAAQSAQDAQASFERGKDPSRERDLATEALYKAEIADGTVAAAKSGADRTAKEEELAVLQKEWDEKGMSANEAAARAEAERAAREAEEARRRLAKFADVKEDERGTIITLAGGIPFKTGKADLQTVAIDRLKVVAEALKGTQRTILVEGHTDSTGSHDLNMRLSKERADTVRRYLVDGASLRLRSAPKVSARTVSRRQQDLRRASQESPGRGHPREAEGVRL
jgi:outer membrane protein OmpA-like peptidoglycan-associated protein